MQKNKSKEVAVEVLFNLLHRFPSVYRQMFCLLWQSRLICFRKFLRSPYLYCVHLFFDCYLPVSFGRLVLEPFNNDPVISEFYFNFFVLVGESGLVEGEIFDKGLV